MNRTAIIGANVIMEVQSGHLAKQEGIGYRNEN